MSVIEYLKDILGLDVTESSNLVKEKSNLPLYLRKMADQEIAINGRRVILAYKNSLKDITPEQLDNQRNVLENNYNAPVVFCFESLAPYERKRLIERKISFIVNRKQVYIPSLMMNLYEFMSGQKMKKIVVSPSTQFLLLYHLQKKSLDGFSLSNIASEIKYYASMSISRSVKELKDLELCSIEGSRAKSIQFRYSKKELWLKALPFLTSPVKKKLYSRNQPLLNLVKKSGDEALSYYSSLNESGSHCVAISERAINESSDNYNYFPSPFGGSYCIEVWKYEPSIMGENNFVDPLSLYLCFKDDSDERVQLALAEILEHVKW